jgi:hypothetical protein
MIDQAIILGGVATVLVAICIHLIRKHFKTKDRSDLYFGIACLFWAAAAVFGILSEAGNAVNDLSLTTLFYRASATSGVLGFLFVNVFAVAITRPNEKRRSLWIPLAAFLIITSIVWGFNPSMLEGVGGTTVFTLTSTYKEPIGPPLIETTIALMAVMAIYPVSLFFRAAKHTKERITGIKSLLIGVGIIVGTASYALAVTGATSYQYLPVCKLGIFVGSVIMFLGQVIYPAKPSMRAQFHAFSKTLGLNHKQTAGRKILFEFDPASKYERTIRDFVVEALASAEQVVIFTRKSSTLHSSLHEYKAAKFFCLTQQSSIPKELSDNEVLLPSGDTSLMLGVLDKTLKAYPNVAINVVFDNLSDLVLSIGFEKTYRFIRYALEILASPRSTIVFLLNRTAHDPKVASSLRSLFSNQVFFGEEGIQAVKLAEAEVTDLL